MSTAPCILKDALATGLFEENDYLHPHRGNKVNDEGFLFTATNGPDNNAKWLAAGNVGISKCWITRKEMVELTELIAKTKLINEKVSFAMRELILWGIKDSFNNSEDIYTMAPCTYQSIPKFKEDVSEKEVVTFFDTAVSGDTAGYLLTVHPYNHCCIMNPNTKDGVPIRYYWFAADQKEILEDLRTTTDAFEGVRWEDCIGSEVVNKIVRLLKNKPSKIVSVELKTYEEGEEGVDYDICDDVDCTSHHTNKEIGYWLTIESCGFNYARWVSLSEGDLLKAKLRKRWPVVNQ